MLHINFQSICDDYKIHNGISLQVCLCNLTFCNFITQNKGNLNGGNPNMYLCFQFHYLEDLIGWGGQNLVSEFVTKRDVISFIKLIDG